MRTRTKDFEEALPGTLVIPTPESLVRGDLEMTELSPGVPLAVWKGAPVILTNNEYVITYCLATHAGLNCSHRQLYDLIREPGHYLEDGDESYCATIRTVMKRVRKKFLAVDPSFDEIKSASAVGYRWGTYSTEEAGAPPKDEEKLLLGGVELYPNAAQAFLRGTLVPLTAGECRVLAKIMADPGQCVPYRALYDIVRGEGFVAGRGPEGYRKNVRTFIKRIRRKFSVLDPSFDKIEVVSGLGYRWGAPVVPKENPPEKESLQPSEASGENLDGPADDPLELHPEAFQAFLRKTPVPLTISEFKILAALAAARGECVPFRKLYDTVHGEGFVSGDGPEGYRTNVRTLIKRIRSKLRSIDETFDRIESLEGTGYRLNPEPS